MADIETVRGLIELQDNFTSQIGVAEAALSHFTKENQESLKAVAGAAGLVVTALLAVDTAALELGKRGSEINDVRATMDHFAGSARAADDDLEALRAGTKGTVDDFELMKTAAHLLSAGVRLDADAFGVLGEAAFVLQNRGLGGTKQQLDLVADALVTGRTRALAMSLGVIDLGNAEENYAKALGVTPDKLSDIGKAEAKRIQVMKLLNSAVADAGKQERDFGEELQAAQAKMSNFVDEVASAVAVSPVFKAAFDSIKTVFQETFGTDTGDMVRNITHFIEDTAIKTTYLANGAIELARVFNFAWSAIKTGVLEVEAIVVGLAAGIADQMDTIAELGSKLHIIPDGTLATIKDTKLQLDAMRDSLDEDVIAASAGVRGQSEFDKTLDNLGGTIDRVRDAMETARAAEDEHTAAAGRAATASNKLADAGKNIAASFDVQKLLDEYDKSFKELETINAQYTASVIKNAGTSGQQQRAEIEATFQKQLESLDRMDPLFKEKYEGYRKIANEELGAIGSEWDKLRDRSIEGLQAQADAALADYEKMITSGLHFNRDVLDEQLEKYHKLQDAVRNHGEEAKKAGDASRDSAADQIKTVESLTAAWDMVAKGVNATKIQVQLLDGEMVSLAEAQRRFDQGSSFTYDLSNKEGIDQYRKQNPAASITWSDDQIEAYIKKGGTLQGLIQTGVINPYGNMQHTGFEQGGDVDIKVGEKGPEVVRVPLGSRVFPNGMIPSTTQQDANSGGDTYIFHVNGDGKEVYRQMKQLLMKDLKSSRKFGSA